MGNYTLNPFMTKPVHLSPLVVGSKVMDMRTSSKDEARREAKEESRKASTDNTNNLKNHCDWNNNCTDTSYECQRESSSNSADNVSARGSTDIGAYDSSFYIPTSGPCKLQFPKNRERSRWITVCT